MLAAADGSSLDMGQPAKAQAKALHSLPSLFSGSKWKDSLQSDTTIHGKMFNAHFGKLR